MPDYASELPTNYYFNGGSDTFTTPLGIAALILATILLLSLHRRYAVVPFLLAGLLIPLSNTIVIASLHFNANRLLLLAGWARLLFRREWFPNRLNSLDKLILFYLLVNALSYSLVWMEFGAIVNRLGFLFTSMGTYFLLRSLIRSKEDIIRVIKVLALVVVVIAPLMCYEKMSRYNLFELIGAPEWSSLRDEQVRAQGPFAHAIIAGTFGVVLIPLFVGLWWNGPHNRVIAVLGVISSTAMMFAASSSTPVLTFPAGLLALFLWPLRNNMRIFRRGIVIILIGLQLMMNAPIWHLMTRVASVLGGSGWHRAMLIENFVFHFFDWFLIGTRNNADWGWSMWDVDNAYVGAGFTGGLLGFILFVAILVRAYRMIGVARWVAEESHSSDVRLIWAIGAALFANTIAFFGIVYFDQSIIAWYALLVMISVTTSCIMEEHVFLPESEMVGIPISEGAVEPI